MEFAIALPLLILLAYGMATVGVKFFEIGRNQLADYVLEEEVHDVMSRLIYDARAAKKAYAHNYGKERSVEFRYRMVYKDENGNFNDQEESRVFIVTGLKELNSKMNYKRKISGNEPLTNPMTGKNYFGETRITDFEFSDPAPNVLRVTLEMQSEVTKHKMRLTTAIYMPGCEIFKVSKI